MFPFFAPQAMSGTALIAATKTMLKVAHTDGLHPAEAALIENFYSSAINESSTSAPSFASLSDNIADFMVEANNFENDAEREMVLALCVMTGFADGSYSQSEQETVRSIAARLQIADERLMHIVEAVKDHMLAQLSHLPDAASVARVAKELG